MIFVTKFVTLYLMNQEIVQKMVSLGYSEYEAKIYFYLLEYGKPRGASKIGVVTGLNRQYIYRGLESLLSSGYVTKVPHGKWYKYKAESENLFLKSQKKKLDDTEQLVQELKKYSKYNIEQDFEVIVGEENLRNFEIRRAEKMKRGSTQYITLANTDDYMRIMGESYTKVGLPIVVKKDVSVKMMGNVPNNKDMLERGLGDNFELKHLSNLHTGVMSTLVCEDYVCFYTYVNPPTVYVIYSEKVAESYKSYFMSLWRNL